MKPRARIITMAWGRPYAETLLSLALPAVLAPGNLPSLAGALECELVIVTEQAFFETIRSAPVFGRLQTYCPVRLFMLDDLIAPKGRYGMTLTYALHRGFADLGPAMREHYLIFFNADFILADGSFRTLADRILAGEQLIHAPSYCVVQERAEPILRERVDPVTQTLAVSHREMAATILAHRHHTVRGKTVNQRVFHSAYIDQFYSQVDDHTLLGRQLPVSLVCMKPERVVTEMRTFWDYGVVAEFCPTTKPCVLGDSDDFLMLEMRTATTALEQMALGWPSVDDIGTTLGKFVTEDQKRMGRYPLVVHSRDLPSGVATEQEKLSAFVEGVYAVMPARAVAHLDHPFWIDHYAPFQAERATYLAGAHGGSASPEQRSADGRPRAAPLLSAARRPGFLRALRSRLVGQMPVVGKLHPFFTILRPTYALMEEQLATPGRRVLILADHEGPLSKFVGMLSARGHVVHALTGPLPRSAADTDRLAAEVRRRGPFDLLVAELTFQGLMRFAAVFEMVRPLLARPGRVIMFHVDSTLRGMAAIGADVIREAIVPVGPSRVFFAGSFWTRVALRLLHTSSRMRARGGRTGLPLFAGCLAGAAVFSAIASAVAGEDGRRAVPNGCLSLTLDYELPALPPG